MHALLSVLFNQPPYPAPTTHLPSQFGILRPSVISDTQYIIVFYVLRALPVLRSMQPGRLSQGNNILPIKTE